jgi:hypothetical protein
MIARPLSKETGHFCYFFAPSVQSMLARALWPPRTARSNGVISLSEYATKGEAGEGIGPGKAYSRSLFCRVRISTSYKRFYNGTKGLLHLALPKEIVVAFGNTKCKWSADQFDAGFACTAEGGVQILDPDADARL